MHDSQHKQDEDVVHALSALVPDDGDALSLSARRAFLHQAMAPRQPKLPTGAKVAAGAILLFLAVSVATGAGVLHSGGGGGIVGNLEFWGGGTASVQTLDGSIKIPARARLNQTGPIPKLEDGCVLLAAYTGAMALGPLVVKLENASADVRYSAEHRRAILRANEGTVSVVDAAGVERSLGTGQTWYVKDGQEAKVGSELPGCH